jgi:hypothetical protein
MIKKLKLEEEVKTHKVEIMKVKVTMKTFIEKKQPLIN